METQDKNVTKAKAKAERGLLRRRLKKDACPTKFPNLAPYFSSEKADDRSGVATTSSRWARGAERADAAAATFLEADKISILQVKHLDIVRVQICENIDISVRILRSRNSHSILIVENVHFQEIAEKLDRTCMPRGVHEIVEDTSIQFYSITKNSEGMPKMAFSLEITEQLGFEMW
jgi:hypothetical protein